MGKHCRLSCLICDQETSFEDFKVQESSSEEISIALLEGKSNEITNVKVISIPEPSNKKRKYKPRISKSKPKKSKPKPKENKSKPKKSKPKPKENKSRPKKSKPSDPYSYEESSFEEGTDGKLSEK